MTLNPSLIEQVKALKLTELENYLSLNGWKKTQVSETSSTWNLESEGETYEILVPAKRSLADYVNRILEAVDTLVILEKRTPEDILIKIINVTSDVIRVRVEGPSTRDGSIPLANGVELVKQTYDMLVAAACTEIEKKLVYPARKYDKAMDYIAGVKLGQTEVGSYVVTAHSPLPQNQTSIVNDAEELFGRRVIKQFARTLKSVERAVVQSLESGDLNAFDEAGEAGASANLCEAIAGIRSKDQSANVIVDLDWAPSFDPPTELQHHFEFTAAQIPILQQAAERFRELTPIENFVLKGWIVRLERETATGPGRVIISAANEEFEGKHIRVDLNSEDYDKAIVAHRAFHVVSCKGSLKKEGRFWHLKDYSDFRTEEVIPESI